MSQKSLPLHTTVDFGHFMVDFIKETDRASVILGASKIEYMLGAILDKFLLPVPSGNDDLLEGDSPLGTLSARIKLCHRLGLLDDLLAKQLHIFRKLRNSYAHEVTANSLSQGASKDRVTALAEPFARTDYFQGLLKKIAMDTKRELSDTGVVFRGVLALFLMDLNTIHDSINTIEPLRLISIKSLCEKMSEKSKPD